MEFSKDNFIKLSEFVYRKSGIALEYDKHFEKLTKTLTKRTKELNLENFRKYFFKLRFEDKDGLEFQELINSITVNETYFFRENYQFEILLYNLLPEINKRKARNEPIRILSAPCSTGEEPYSMAIHIIEDNKIVNERDIEIIGIDIDSTVIQKAKAGLYTNRSIHTLSEELKNKYFKTKMGYNEIISDIRDAIKFEQCNVFDKEQIRKLGKFDVIFSRNMLIYFDDASRKEVAMTFYDMLLPNGYVLLGHAEYMNRIVSVFNPKKFNNHLVYQK